MNEISQYVIQSVGIYIIQCDQKVYRQIYYCTEAIKIAIYPKRPRIQKHFFFEMFMCKTNKSNFMVEKARIFNGIMALFLSFIYTGIALKYQAATSHGDRLITAFIYDGSATF